MKPISARDVQALREQTGAGIMDCKKALAETQGQLDKAVEFLRKKGLSASAKKAGRVASEGAVGSYIHGAGKIGVMVEVNCETDFVGRNEDFQRFVRDVAMHIAAAAPLYVSREEVPPALIAKEHEIIAAQVAAEVQAMSDSVSPQEQETMIAKGQAKFLESICLLEQPFVKATNKSVEDVQSELVAKIGEKIQIRRFIRYQLGEGLAKRSENFADEVRAVVGG